MSVKAGPAPRRGRARGGEGAGLPGPVDRRCHWLHWPWGGGPCAHAPCAGSSSGRRRPAASAPVPGEPQLRWQLVVVSAWCRREAELGEGGNPV